LKPLAQDVRIDYTNWRNERSSRIISPIELFFGSNLYHPEAQWLLVALDVEKNATRTFALKNIHHWQPARSTHMLSEQKETP
jgi:predicted DNA-binding transcriptional regulator YafY